MTPQQKMYLFRELRDSAKNLVQADVAMVREDMAQRSVGGRLIDRVTDATFDMLDDAVDAANENRSGLAIATAAIGAAGAMWIKRDTVLHWVEDIFGDN